VLFGGFGVGKSGNYTEHLGDTWEWDGKHWYLMPDTSVGTRARHRMAYGARAGLVVLYGGDGQTQPGSAFRYLDDTWAWDGKRWAEENVPGPTSRFMHAMAYDESRGKTVLYAGGLVDSTFSDTWEWDEKEWQAIK
jgi:hypothetical protein